jgi:hypothetical protein
VRRLWTPRWALVHVGLVIAVAGCLALGWWQLQRAASGNLLSFGYAIQWPAFAGFAVWVWLKEVRKALGEIDTGAPVPAERAPSDPGGADPTRPDSTRPDSTEPAGPRPARTSRQRPRSGPAYDDSGDSELAAYNDYLAWLNAHPNANPANYPGPARSEEKT